MNNMIEGVTHIRGVIGGPKVCIIGALHGNEKVGGIVVEKLMVELSGLELFGEVYLVIGNPLAYEKGVRFIDEDMNRLFVEGCDLGGGVEVGGEGELLFPQEKVVEGRRAGEIAQILKHVDYLLDLHSTIKPSTAFAYCEGDSEHVALAKFLGVGKIVSPSNNFRPLELVSSADNFVDNNGGIGITFESGWCENIDAASDVLEGVKKFLQKLKVYDFGFDLDETCQIVEHFRIYDDIVPVSDKFMFSQDFSGFDFVKSGEIIASDNGEPIEIDIDSFIIFPKKDITANKVACYLAQKL